MYGYYPWTWPLYWPAAAPALAPAMAGAESPERILAPYRPRVVTTLMAEGRAQQCLPAGEFRYRRGERVEVLRAAIVAGRRYYLVMTRAGCVGWVPADHVAVRRRMGANGEDEWEVEFLGEGGEVWD